MRLADDADVSRINWKNLAHRIRRQAEGLPPGVKRNAELDRALTCEALAYSKDLLLQTRTA
jgi:hypothetical protein